MKRQLSGILAIVFLLAVVLILIRLFPRLVMMAEAAAIGVQQFWLMILIIALGAWLVWVFSKRNSG